MRLEKKEKYQRVFNAILKNDYHNVDALINVVEEAKKDSETYVTKHSFNIDLYSILNDCVWTPDEKIKLINYFADKDLQIIDKNKTMSVNTNDRHNAFRYLIYNDMFDSFKVLSKAVCKNKNISNYVYNNQYTKYFDNRKLDELDFVMWTIFADYNSYIGNRININKSKYVKEVIKLLNKKERESFFKTRYLEYDGMLINRSAFFYVLMTKDIKLIKAYYKYLDNPSEYLPFIIRYCNMDVLKYFVENGADVNYMPEEPKCDYVSPIKAAIETCDLDKFYYLIEHGAIFNKDIKPINKDDNHWCDIAYNSTPISYATLFKNNEIQYAYSNIYTYNVPSNLTGIGVEFHTASRDKYSHMHIDLSNMRNINNRMIMVDYIYNNLTDEERREVDFNALLKFTLIAHNIPLFFKYGMDLAKYEPFGSSIEFSDLITIFVKLNFDQKDDAEAFCHVLSSLDNNGMDIYKELASSYANKYNFKVTDAVFYILSQIPEEERIKICLVPHCSDVKSLSKLISLGFDVNQVDEIGDTCLHNMIPPYAYQCVDVDEEELDFLINHTDLTIKNKYKQTPISMLLRVINTRDDLDKAIKDSDYESPDKEKLLLKFIEKMSLEDLIKTGFIKKLEERFISSIWFDFDSMDAMSGALLYKNYRKLFDELFKKGYKPSDKMINAVFYRKSYSPFDKDTVYRYVNNFDVLKSKEYILSNFDKNKVISKIDLSESIDKVLDLINSSCTFQTIAIRLITLNDELGEAKKHLRNDISKKYSPGDYIGYVKEKYHTDYENLDGCVFDLIIKILNKYGSDKLLHVLKMLDNFDINYVKEDIVTDLKEQEIVNDILSTWTLDDDGEVEEEPERFFPSNLDMYSSGFVELSGSLIHYAIMVNDLELVKKLYKLGVNPDIRIDGKSITRAYVSSKEMLKYIDEISEDPKYKDLDDEEIKLYKKMINKAKCGVK